MDDPRASSDLERILGYTRRIAVVGLSDDPYRASYGVARVLLDGGYEIVPVNPSIDEVFGLQAYPSLMDVPGDVDLVDVFRRSEHAASVAHEAVAIGARGLWLQLGIRSAEARRIAQGAGLDYVEDLCLKIEVARARRVITLPVEAAR